MHISFVFPGNLDTPTGGYRYDRAIIHEWQKMGVNVHLISLPGSYPNPSDEEKQTALSLLDSSPPSDCVVIDGLAGGGFPELLQQLSKSAPVIPLIHHPLCLETGLSKEQADTLQKAEEKGLAFAKAVITSSPNTTRTVEDLFGFQSKSIYTIIPGVERAETIPFRSSGPLNLLCIGSITARKGHDVLLDAMRRLDHRSWHLDIVGASHFDPALFQRLTAFVRDQNLDEKVSFHGAVEATALDDFYRNADIFVLASRYEGYGMVFSEAIVRGIPVVSTTAGAIPDTVPEQAGLLVPTDDSIALAKALKDIMTDKDLRYEKHLGALTTGSNFPTWEQSARDFLEHLRTLK